MSFIGRSLVLAYSLMALVGTARSDIQLNVESGGSWVENTGVKTLQIFANSNSADQLLSLAADIQLSGGIFTPTPGAFGQAGFVGNGNLSVNSGFERDNANLGLAYLSLDFNADQLFSNANQTLATLSFNINGLAPGDYNITFPLLDAQGVGGPIGIAGGMGSFTITAVPEPATLVPAMLLGATGVLKLRRRRRRTKPGRLPAAA